MAADVFKTYENMELTRVSLEEQTKRKLNKYHNKVVQLSKVFELSLKYNNKMYFNQEINKRVNIENFLISIIN